jgi:hypothetical protein
MVAANLSLASHTFMMDEFWIETIYLSQVFSAIYDTKTVNKMYLLSNVKNRSDAKGIITGDFAAMLLIDFVKSREKEDTGAKPHEKKAASIMDNKALCKAREKLAMSYQSGHQQGDNCATINTQDLFKTTKKSDQDFGSPTRPMTERKMKAQSGFDVDWGTAKDTFSERKPKTQVEIKKEQKIKMM